MSSTQAPVFPSSSIPNLEGPDHFNRLIQAFDKGGIRAPGGVVEFEFTEEEGNTSRRHRVKIRAGTPPAWAKSALWRHNGHIAEVFLDDAKTPRAAVRRMLEGIS